MIVDMLVLMMQEKYLYIILQYELCILYTFLQCEFW